MEPYWRPDHDDRPHEPRGFFDHALVSLHYSLRAPCACWARDQATARPGSRTGSKRSPRCSRCRSVAFRSSITRSSLLVRLDPEVARGWSDGDVVRRWAQLFPPRDKARKLVPVSNDWVRGQQKDSGSVAQARMRLQNLGWFMKSLKEPLARLANREEKTRGVFFEGRFKSVGILDPQSLVASSVSSRPERGSRRGGGSAGSEPRTSLMAHHQSLQGSGSRPGSGIGPHRQGTRPGRDRAANKSFGSARSKIARGTDRHAREC